jgi:hypothetical protein
MELGMEQAPVVSKLLSGWKSLEILNDLQGFQRVIACEKP